MRIALSLLLMLGCTRITDDELAWRIGGGGSDGGEECTDSQELWTDVDGDGYGDPELMEDPCAPSENAVENDLDCDDGNAAVHPDATESCETEGDDNCDGETNALDALSCTPFYLDQDGDGYGLSDDEVCACEAWESYGATLTGDCDDSTDVISPGVDEICNNDVDDNCDGASSECDLSGESVAESAVLRVLGGNTSDVLGVSVAGKGDLTGDGLGDLVLCATGGDLAGASAGQVYIIPGNLTGTIDLSETLSDEVAVLTGGSADDRLGWSVATTDDFDGDGYAELLVGALYESTGDYRAGAAYVLSGLRDGVQSVDDAGIRYTGEASEDYLGSSIGFAGDHNGDGELDVIIGAYRESSVASNSGAAYLVPGPHESSESVSDVGFKLTGENSGDRAGIAVAGIGDVDGDGLDDLAIGADREDTGGSNSGTVYVVLGSLSSDLSLADADARFSGTEVNQNAGYSVSGAGDVNGDGHQDLLVGGPGQSTDYVQRGAVWIIHGPMSGSHSLTEAAGQLQGMHAADRFGHSVSGAGDVDGDGLEDVWIGAPEIGANPSSPTGAALFFYGPVSGGLLADDADYGLWGDQTDDEAGQDVAGVGDVNGDSRPDLLVGISDSDHNGSVSGSAVLVLGGGL